jgi:hypothetical protein
MAGWERTLDLLSRTTYVSAGFVDRILDDDTRKIANVWNAAREAADEFHDPQERLTFSDVLKNHAPEWSNEHPALNFVAGLGMDIALDPLTYVGPGAIKGIGHLTGGILRGGSKAARTMNAIRKGSLYDDIGEATARGIAVGIEDAFKLGGEGEALARAGVELNETKRAAQEINAARKQAARSVEKRYNKRLQNLQKRHAKEIVKHTDDLTRAEKATELEALKDIEQYGVTDARRVREIRQQWPALPEQSVRQAAQVGRDSRLAAEVAPRTAGRTKKVAELRKAKEGREAFQVVPEKAINPQFGAGQGPGRMTEAGEIIRRGPALADDAGQQMALRTTEAEPSTVVRSLGKPVKDPMRGRGGVPHSDEIVSYVDELKAPVQAAARTDLAKISLRQQQDLKQLMQWKQRALNDGLNVQMQAKAIGRGRAAQAKFRPRYMAPTEKRVADFMTFNKLQEVSDQASKMGWTKALKDEWKQLTKPAKNLSGVSKLDEYAATGDSWLSNKADFFKELFERDYKLPDWLIKHREMLYGKLLSAVPKVQDELANTFGRIDKATSEKLGQKFYEIFWETEKVKKAQGGLRAGQAAEIRAAGLADLSDQERIIAGKVYQKFREIGELDVAAKLVDDLYENYVPGLYQNLEKNFFGMSKKLKKQIPNEFTPGEAKLFKSLDEVTAAGLKPVRDLQTIYTARVLAHEQGLAQAMFNDSLKMMYPGLDMVKQAGPDELLRYKTSVNIKNLKKKFPKAKQATDGPHKGAWLDKDGSLLTPSDRVINEISYIGNGIYGPESFQGANRIAHAYDKALNVFRAGATVLKPAFAFKQIVSNTAQVYFEFGAKGVLRMYDPRTIIDTAMIMSRNEGKFALKGVMGEHISGKQLLSEIRELGVMTNTPMDVGLAKHWNPRNVREMQRLVNRERAIRTVAQDSQVAEGFTRTFMGALKYTDLPGHVEDWGRVSTYITARRLGFAPDAAKKHMTNALFDYMHGLSEFEAKWMRRVIPFYSYQRFAIPLMARTIAQAPGRVANAAKVTDAFFQSFNKFDKGENLTDSERMVIPGWLMDQPSSFREFDDRMQATFGTFNSFTPLDILTNFQELFGLEQKGKFDLDETMGRALEKGVLSQITPVFKWPLEAMINRKFFQGSQVARITRSPGMQKVAQEGYDADIFFSNLVGATTAILARRKEAVTAWALIGKFMGKEIAEQSPRMVEEFLELATGWEEGIDPETGERTIYMSPHRIHIMTSFMPFLKEVFRQSDPNLTPMEKTLSLYTGQQTVKINLGDEKRRKMKEARTVINRKAADAQGFYVQQRMNEYDGALADLQSYYDEIGDHMLELERHGVREATPTGYGSGRFGFNAEEEDEKQGLSFSKYR